ncbi:MAG: response regulator [Bryobacteraceae bacterium]
MQRVDTEVWSSREVARLLSLVENERRYYQEMFRLLPVGIAVLNREMGIVASNRAFRQIFGLSAEAVAETTLDQLQLHGVAAAAAQVADSGVRRSAFNPAVATPGGTRPLRIHLSRFRDWEDSATGEVLLVVEDLSAPVERIRAETQASATRLREQLARVPALVWQADLAAEKFTAVNTEALTHFDVAAEAWMPGAGVFGSRVRESDREALKQQYQKAGAFSCDYRALSTAGAIRWMRDFVRVKDNVASGVTVDVTWARKRDLAGAEAAKVEALTHLSGRVVHDCNNLLMITSGYGEELLHGLAPDDPLRANAQQILTASDRLSKMTRSLSAYVKHPSPEQQTFAIDPLLDDLRKEIGDQFAHQAELNMQLGAPGATVQGDPGLVVHAIRALAERSAAAMMDSGRITIESSVVESGARTVESGAGLNAGLYARVAIRDNGHAIHPDILGHLFEPQIATDLEQFGLPAIYKSLREMGGDLSASSSFGQGSVFTILLPCERVEEAAPAADAGAEAPSAQEQPETRTATVLIVEDEAGIRTLMRRILDREGYNLLEAGHGKAALEVARNHPGPIDLLVTDIVMPEMTGFELAREIRAFRDDLRVLFISGYTGLSGADPEQMKEGSAFLQKPFTLNAFVAKVRELLDS